MALPKPLSEKGRKIRKALMALQPDKKLGRRGTQKRASMVVVHESAEEQFGDLFVDDSEMKELERSKKVRCSESRSNELRRPVDGSL